MLPLEFEMLHLGALDHFRPDKILQGIQENSLLSGQHRLEANERFRELRESLDPCVRYEMMNQAADKALSRVPVASEEVVNKRSIWVIMAFGLVTVAEDVKERRSTAFVNQRSEVSLEDELQRDGILEIMHPVRYIVR